MCDTATKLAENHEGRKNVDVLGQECSEKASTRDCWWRRCSTPAVAALVGGAPSSSSGRPSPMEAEGEVSALERTVEQFSASSGIPEQRREKRVRFGLPKDPSQDGRMRLNMKQASGTDAEELEP